MSSGRRSPLHEQLATLARYHVWATERLLAAVDGLAEDEYRRPAGLFFGSIHGTLNHLLVAEAGLWFRRFAEGVSPAMALDTEIEPDRSRLRVRLGAATAAWAPWLAGCSDADLAGTLRYTRTSGVTVELPFAATLAHVFNHATHHRGQVTAALSAAGHGCPELDLVFMLQKESATR